VNEGARILVVDDEPAILRMVRTNLERHDLRVEAVATGREALAAYARFRPDLVLLDLGLPDVDGREVLRMLRAVSAIPVIITTARDGEPTIIDALDIGADDFVIKPFGVHHLDARIRAVLRRGRDSPAPDPLTAGELALDPVTRVVTLSGQTLDLTRREFDLLHYLMQRPGAVISRRELVAEVWRQPFVNADKTIDVHLSWLRRKLGEDARAPRYVHTIRGVGVRFGPAGPS
jgi:two-component system KDP operon response regulator KdpE